MCTSIFMRTEDNKHILARTMDFSYPLDAKPIYIPREHNWVSGADNKQWNNELGFLGTGSSLGKDYFVCDGVNEAGISIAELYLPGEALYQKEAESGSLNFCPHEFIMWVLGNISSIEELGETLDSINLVERPVPMLGFVTPLHWIITDKSGKSVVIEPTEKKLRFKEDPVEVMTNTPQLEWHLENLRNYLNVRPEQFDPINYGGYEATAFSQGTGTSGLPGGYTPPERFVRATFFKQFIEKAADENEGVMNALHILATVSIPKGVVVKSTGEQDYSQFISMMCNESRTVYFNDYATNGITRVTMTEELLEQREVKIFEIDKTPVYK